tara:strand:+ start:55 stop:285 length:231 start_codon:yes stop_codon:yes gene_type:complete
MKKYRHLRGKLFDIERELRTRNSGADEAISEAFHIDDKKQARTSVVSKRSSGSTASQPAAAAAAASESEEIKHLVV